MTFAQLSVGEEFEFDHTGLMFHRDTMHGPWVKTGKRTYRTERTPHTYTVGTIRVKVRQGAECGGAR